MKASTYNTAKERQLRNKLLKQLGDAPRRLSTYRMLRSPEFTELCRFYTEGVGFHRFEQFMEYALRLEETLHPLKIAETDSLAPRTHSSGEES